MSDNEQTPNRNAAFLPIGITFLAVGLAMLIGPASASAWAFIPVGITFLVIWLSGYPKPDNGLRRPKRGGGSAATMGGLGGGDGGGGGGGE
jgi:hypothetical protein